jgi:Proteins of 100 residues with WXG
MADVEVLIDYEAVIKVAAQFNTSAEQYTALLAPLQAAAEALQNQAFIGLTGNAAAVALADIQTRIRHIVERCYEMVQDLNVATAGYRAGDSQAADRFQN